MKNKKTLYHEIYSDMCAMIYVVNIELNLKAPSIDKINESEKIKWWANNLTNKIIKII